MLVSVLKSFGERINQCLDGVVFTAGHGCKVDVELVSTGDCRSGVLKVRIRSFEVESGVLKVWIWSFEVESGVLKVRIRSFEVESGVLKVWIRSLQLKSGVWKVRIRSFEVSIRSFESPDPEF